jgi:hypothetical protein
MRGLGTDPHPYFSTPLMEDMGGATLTPSRRRLVNHGSHGGVDYVQVWDLVTREVVVDVRPVAVGIAGYSCGFISETQFYAIRGDGLWLCDIYGGGQFVTNDLGGYFAGSPDYKGGTVFTYGYPADVSHIIHYLESDKLVPLDVGFACQLFFEDTDGTAWMIGPVNSGGETLDFAASCPGASRTSSTPVMTVPAEQSTTATVSFSSFSRMRRRC